MVATTVDNAKEIYTKCWKTGRYLPKKPPYHHLFNFLDDYGVIPDNKIDIGCGCGLSANTLKDKFNNCHVTGIDIAGEKIKESLLDDFIHDDINNINFNSFDKTFDLTIITNVLEHLREDEVDNLFIKIKKANINYHYIVVSHVSSKLDNTELHILQRDFKWWVNKFKSHGYDVYRCGATTDRSSFVLGLSCIQKNILGFLYSRRNDNENVITGWIKHLLNVVGKYDNLYVLCFDEKATSVASSFAKMHSNIYPLRINDYLKIQCTNIDELNALVFDQDIVEKVLNTNKINIVYKHALFDSFVLEFDNFIKSRNYLQKKYFLRFNLIDTFWFEGGLLRPDNKRITWQVDNVGWNVCSSLEKLSISDMRHKTKSNSLNIDEFLKNEYYPFNNYTVNSKNELKAALGTNSYDKIVFVPLQVNGDSTILYWSHIYRNMDMVIKSIKECANNMTDTLFVIKDHPKQNMPVNFHIVDNTSNVFILNNDLTTHDLLKHSDIVCVCNSTCGFEAMAYNKPVIMLADSSYGKSQCVTRCKTTGDIMHAINVFFEESDDERNNRIDSQKILVKYVVTEFNLVANTKNAPDYSVAMRKLINKKALYYRLSDKITKIANTKTKIGINAINNKNVVSEKLPYCDWFYEHIVVLSDGRVTTCCADVIGENSMGNAHDDNMLDIWDGEKYINFRKKAKQFGIANTTDKCRKCSVFMNKTTYCSEEIKKKTPIKAAFPPTLQIEVVSLCNADCTECMFSKHRDINKYRNKKIMPFETFKKIIDDTYLHVDVVRLYNYGEHFLHQNAFEMIRYIKNKNKNIFVYVSTNFWLFTNDEKINNLIESGIDRVVVSLHGGTQKTASGYMPTVNFDQVVDNMRNFIRIRNSKNLTKPQIGWKSVLFPWNDSDDDMQQMRNLAQDIGVDRYGWELSGTQSTSEKFKHGSVNYENLVKNDEIFGW